MMSAEPHRVTQNELNQLVRDMELPKGKAELLASRLQQWNLLDDNVNVSAFRSRQKVWLNSLRRKVTLSLTTMLMV
jgi:hypothetical protein